MAPQPQKRGKFCFELRTTDGGKGYAPTTETEADLQEWVDTVSRAVALTRDDRLSVTSETSSATDGPGTPALGEHEVPQEVSETSRSH